MKLTIGNKDVLPGKAYIIAEIGNNHNGSLTLAKDMVDQAVKMGADCAKFQMRNLDEVYRQKSINNEGEDLGTEYVLDLLKRFELSTQEHLELFNYCKNLNIEYLCTPWDQSSVKTLESFGVPAFKVASADLTNMPLLDTLTKTGKPLILSTGMSTEEEVQHTADFLNLQNAEFVLLHCNSTYPAPLHDINLNWMKSIQKIHPLVGYSGHERGINVALASIALNACVVERHFTVDRNMEGPDHAASLTFEEFKLMIDGIREIETALGTDVSRHLSQGEMINRENLGKSIVASSSLKKGKIISSADLMIKSPGQGISPQFYNSLIGLTLARDMKKEDFFYSSDLGAEYIEPKDYSFDRPWGIPVRFHDFHEYSEKIKPDLWEFHLSYSDMELDPNAYLKNQHPHDFVVHAPELFSGSHLMDLASENKEYRMESIRETQKVIDLTRKLNKFFPSTQQPMIVTNIGGFSMDEPIHESKIPMLYEIFSNSLNELDQSDVEIIPQTMAPFPWHFGGQRFQNLFVNPEEIAYWCDQLNLRMCFDISHSRLTCNHFNYDFYEFATKISTYTAHLHLGDASGVNGEGLQIGEGDIDFVRLGEILKGSCPHASFIPEIWQGHKNGGEGFWIALNKLEQLL
ncbi:N-acetylneuraminate synthase family protein [Pseudomonadota bacterium]|jgi:sialic acid synthase SpsE/endonuclease IV|nr:N-acetylneuraminate synthase family protein [Pseudomonadota bacterium]